MLPGFDSQPVKEWHFIWHNLSNSFSFQPMDSILSTR